MAKSLWRCGAAVLWVVLLFAGCRGRNGDDGQFHVRFLSDTNVTQMTLTGVGVPLTGALPDPSTSYTLARLQGTVVWNAGSPTTTRYAAPVGLQPNEGDKGQDGILPAGIPINGVAAKNGDDGEDKSIVILMSGTTLFVLSDKGALDGTLLP